VDSFNVQGPQYSSKPASYFVAYATTRETPSPGCTRLEQRGAVACTAVAVVVIVLITLWGYLV
jgi:hypothetical protein